MHGPPTLFLLLQKLWWRTQTLCGINGFLWWLNKSRLWTNFFFVKKTWRSPRIFDHFLTKCGKIEKLKKRVVSNFFLFQASLFHFNLLYHAQLPLLFKRRKPSTPSSEVSDIMLGRRFIQYQKCAISTLIFIFHYKFPSAKQYLSIAHVIAASDPSITTPLC